MDSREVILLEGARRRARKGLRVREGAPLRALEKVSVHGNLARNPERQNPNINQSTLNLSRKHLPRVYDRVLGC